MMNAKHNIIPSTRPYQGIVVISPLALGEDRKDQDRARFFEPGLVGCVCDGVTASPGAAEAAQSVTAVAPILFDGDIPSKLRMICDLLMAQRRECQMKEWTVPSDKPEGMQAMLREALRQKQAQSYQTTLVAVRLRLSSSGVVADIVQCGDSAFFAFAEDGELLRSSVGPSVERPSSGHNSLICSRWRFGPGDRIHVRVEGLLDADEEMAGNSGIQARHLRNWLICRPVDGSHHCGDDDRTQTRGLVLTPADELLVPRYLYGRPFESGGQEYRTLCYSSLIRIVPSVAPEGPTDSIEHRGSATLVLPDHYHSGLCNCTQDRFPCGTHFVLCSDGFYGAFATADELWQWLQEYRQLSQDEQGQQAKLQSLHARLHEKSGDDDISFVWMFPAPSPEAKEDGNETTPEV
jgi:hypothetical protein